MSAGGECVSWPRTIRAVWPVVFIAWALISCVTTGSRQAPVPTPPPHRPRLTVSYCPTEGEALEPPLQGYDIPGRDPDSRMPWEFFLGHAAHRMIAYIYGVNHPDNEAYYNSESIKDILERLGLGDMSRLRPDESTLRPDITDLTLMCLFEIKPWNDRGLQEGRKKVRSYLEVLNRITLPRTSFVSGTDFQGEILIRFAQGQYIWRLKWNTTEPGVVLYRWTRSQQRFESEAEAYEAGAWVELTEQELRQYGRWVGQAVDEMVSRRERLTHFDGVIGVVIDTAGTAAMTFFSGAILERMGSGSGTQQPPTQQGGKLIPFPARTSPAERPVQLPATGMSLPR